MCYSAMVKQNAKKLSKRFEAQMELPHYLELFKRRFQGEKLYINKAMEQTFTENPQGPVEKEIAKYIEGWHEQEITRIEQELFKQTKRLNDAERILKTKTTKKAENDVRIATNKISKAKFDLERHRSSKIISEVEERVFPLHYMSMLCLNDEDQKMIRPVRYLMRPHNKDEKFDIKFNGCYNARFDGLESVPWWKDSFSTRHGIIVVSKFYENVALEDYKGPGLKLVEDEKPKNLVLCFKPDNVEFMFIPTLWDKWVKKGSGPLYSAALITDDPAPEIAAAGHDRTPIFLKESAVDDWLNAKTVAEAHEVLTQRERPHYSHTVMGVA